MNLFGVVFCLLVVGVWGKECPAKRSNSKLFCYYSKLTDVNSCECSHVILPANSDVKSVDRLREHLKGVKVLISVNEFNQGLVDLLKTTKVDGLEISLKKLDSKEDINDFISTVRSKLGSDLYMVVSVPSKTETLAKYFDFKSLSKNADLFILQTGFLGANKNVTFHPSRLSGLWDMQNTDSVVDLVSGLGAPLSKLVVTVPVQAFQFTLQSPKFTAPGSPALEVKSIDRNELCSLMKNSKNWTLERDQDQAGPYIFSEDQWIAFEDSTSMDIKAKYSRVRGLAGIALKDLSQDGGLKCESTILEAASNGLSRQARAPRGAVLHSLEREMLASSARPLDSIQVSPYRISRVIDTEGSVHVIRQDTRTEFECSRQGYFVHPRSCNRFYRCVKFDQLSDEFSVFEFDCPAGLAFDERVEVCVWPGSLPHASACAGSSEIAPVPRERFICPGEPGYYADPENCRWFFACLDHGRSPLSAYEFRCPFGLVFDQDKLLCEWPWFVPRCASGEGYGLNLATQNFYGTGYLLDQYDGLGSLGAVKLGGLSGTINQPVAKVYSNVGTTHILGLNNGLSEKASISLVNAGLLKTGSLNSGSNLASGTLLESTGFLHNSNIASGSLLGQAKLQTLDNSAKYESKQAVTGLDFGSGSLHGSTIASGTLLSESNLAILDKSENHGAKSHQTITQYHDKSNSGYASSNDNYKATSQQAVLGLDLESNQASGTLFHSTGLNIASGSLLGQTNLGDSGNYGAKSHQTITQYHDKSNSEYTSTGDIEGRDNSDGILLDDNQNTKYFNKLQYDNTASIGLGTFGSAQYNQAALGNINIINGGYSAFNDGVQVSSNGNNNQIPQVTSSPTASSIPIVTSVPIPNIKTVKTFETYNGGVVANVPHLQYKVEQNVEGYSYPKPAVSFQEGSYIIKEKVQPATLLQSVKLEPKPISFVKPIHTLNVQNTVQQSGGYVYNKPSVAFEEKPFTVTQSSINLGSIQTVKEQNTVHQSGGYVYNKPSVAFEERPITVTQPSVSSVHIKKQENYGGYVYKKPSVTFEETHVKQVTVPDVPTVQVNKHESYGGYIYNKPSVTFEENPQQVNAFVSVYRDISTPKPQVFLSSTPSIVEHKVVQPVVYSTPRPFTISSTSTPYVHQQPIISVSSPRPFSISSTTLPVTYAYNYKQIAKQVGYSYPKPSVAFAEQPAVKVQPITYNVQQPVVQSQGYVYEKPKIVFEEKPLVKVQPAVSTYQIRQPFAEQQIIQQQSQGYIYEKPKVAFEEKPQIRYQKINLKTDYVKPVEVQPIVAQPVVVSTYHYQQPSVQKSVVGNVGYQYPKPSLQFVEQPKPIIHKPAVVSTYHVQQQPLANEVKSYGYAYPKPSVAFEEKPVVSTYAYQQPIQTYNYKYEAPVTQKTTYQNIVPLVKQQPAVFSTYTYQKPAVTKYTYKDVVQNTYIAPSVATYTTPRPTTISSYNYVQPTSKPIITGNSYPKPSVTFVEEPKPKVTEYKQAAVVSTYNYATTSKPVLAAYTYPKPSVTFVEEPKPIVTEYKQQAFVPTYNYVAPTSKPVVTGYTYPKPSVTFVEEPKPTVQEYKQPAVVSTYNYVTPTVKPKVVQPVVTQYKPVVTEYRQPAVVSSYSYVAPTQKPKVIEQQPLVEYKQPTVLSTYNYIAPTTPKTEIFYKKPEQTFLTEYRQPAIITSYNYVQQTTPKPKVIQQPIVTKYKQPAVVQTYNYLSPTTQRPTEYTQPTIVEAYNYVAPTTQRPIVQQPIVAEYKQPVVVKTYNYFTTTTQRPQVVVQEYRRPQVASTYTYEAPKQQVVYKEPVVQQYETLQPIKEVPFVKKKVYSTGYKYDKPAIKFEEQPVYVENYSAPRRVVSTTPVYQKDEQYNSDVLTSNYYYENKVQGVRYSTTPQYEEEFIATTPNPTYISTVQAVIAPKVKITPVVYEQRRITTVQPIVEDFSTSRPIARYSFSSLDTKYQQPAIPIIVSTERIPKVQYARQRVKVTTPKYVETYENPEVTTARIRVRPTKEYLPVVQPTREYLPVKTTTILAPTREYLPETTTVKATTYLQRSREPSREYIPVTTTVKPTTYSSRTRGPSREYLPVRSRVRVITSTTTEAYGDEAEIQITTRRPSKVVKIGRPTAKTIIKQNDFHPLLAAKLGAQCTCVSNTVKLRKKKPEKIIVVEEDNEDDEDDDEANGKEGDDDNDVYLVNTDDNDDENSNGVIVESYKYDPKKTVVEITPTPEVYIKSTTGTVPSSTTQAYKVKKRLRVIRPLPTTEATEILIKSRVTPVKVVEVTTDGPSDRQIAKAVRTGLKLVKLAAKEGAKEGTEEVLSKSFDRYGPGGVRSKNEKLQGTVDCQRAGLFRHPTQCNKFYACRWDCKKNRFTLHVFNCPVHLTFDNNLGACNWPSQGPACLENTLLPSD
ncbi:unnamed protein product [Brassicogethes aeneus]|uniref:Uncharacterized protein n=1 Tax=Brassicogethes aeneus TaxID=1431903 RepID=A0A9P0FQ17_BRAAE|nr:unnamed protein product [Brassicogethes aeneus]